MEILHASNGTTTEEVDGASGVEQETRDLHVCYEEAHKLRGIVIKSWVDNISTSCTI